MGVMGFLGDLRGRNSKSPPNPLGLRSTSPRPPPQRPPSSREGDRPQAVEGVPLPRSVKRCSSRYLHLTGFTRRSSPPALPPIAYRGFAIAPITLRPLSKTLAHTPRTPPQIPPSSREGDRPQAVEGVPAHRATPIPLRSPSRSPLYNPGSRVATLVVSMGVMGFLGDLRGENRNSPLIP